MGKGPVARAVSEKRVVSMRFSQEKHLQTLIL